MGQLLKKFTLKMSYHFHACQVQVFWMVTMLRTHIDMVNKSVSDYIEDYSTILVPAILLITLWLIFFENSLLKITFIVIVLFIIYL